MKARNEDESRTTRTRSIATHRPEEGEPQEEEFMSSEVIGNIVATGSMLAARGTDAE